MPGIALRFCSNKGENLPDHRTKDEPGEILECIICGDSYSFESIKETCEQLGHVRTGGKKWDDLSPTRCGRCASTLPHTAFAERLDPKLEKEGTLH